MSIVSGFRWSLLKDLLVSTASRWSDHNAPRLGAALAYYSVLSVAPLIVVLVGICGLVLDKSTAQQELVKQIRELAGANIAGTLQLLLNNTRQPGTGLIASTIALVTLLFGASGVFMELRESLNTIWDAPPSSSGMNVAAMVWQRLVSFAMVLGLGAMLLLSLLLSAGLAFVERIFTGLIPLPAALVGEALNLVISTVALTCIFALVYKLVPDVPIAWRDVWIGAFATAVLFMIGRTLLALYLSTAAVGSTYGAAGSLVAFVVWIYYSAQIFFFGAVFTRIYSERFGSHAAKPQSSPSIGTKLTDSLMARSQRA
jgi:membrane protein